MARQGGAPVIGYDPGRRRTTSEGSSPSVSGGKSQKSAFSDRYALGEELGRGAFGQVFKATDTQTGDIVAIKQMSLSGITSDNLQAIVGEIDLLKNLRHKNIVKYIGSFKTRTHLSIILEYMEKGSLADVIRPAKFGAFPESLAAVYIAQVLHGLAYLHEQGVVHRDIKGANILTGNESVVKLADFGVAAKLTGASEGDESLTQSVVGTPYWMAPEVIEMTSVTAAADIWSVGCLTIELLTGQPPYFDLQPMSALFRIVQDEHPALPENVTEDMQGFLLECFQKDPQRRPGAKALLRHAWLRQQRATLRSTWSNTVKARGGRTDAHASVTNVVERILQADGDDTSSLGPETASESGEESQLAPRKSKGGMAARKDSAGSLESRAAPRSIGGPELSGSARSSVAELPERPSLLKRPSASASESHFSVASLARSAAPASGRSAEPSLVTPAQRSEPPRSRTPQRPPPLDTSSPGLGKARSSDECFDGDPLGTLLASLSASNPLPSHAGGPQDLLSWLEDSDMQNGAMPAGSPKPVNLPGTPGAAPKHQQAAEIRRLVGALRPVVPNASMSGGAPVTARDTPVLDACQQLTGLLAEQQERRSTFMAENGVAALIELLDEHNAKVALAALEVTNALVSNDVRILEASCLMGLVPAVLRYAYPIQPLLLRTQAAAFAHALCHGSAATARMFVACQGMPVLAALTENSLAESGFLTQTGITCTWQMLQMQGPFPLNHLCRLLAADNMPLRLVLALDALCSELRPSPTASQGHESPTESRYAPSEVSGSSVPEELSLEDDAVSRVTSNSHASTSRGVGSSRLSNIGLNGYFRSSRQSGATVAPAAPAVRRVPKQAAHRRGSSLSGSSPDVLASLIETVGNILLVMAHADSVVKGAIGRKETLLALFVVMSKLDRRERALLKCLKCLRLLTFDPALLQPLQDAGTIPKLLPFLGRTNPVTLQLEALHALYNLCKISRTRQEAAAVAGVVPRLIALVSSASAKAQEGSNGREGQQSAQLRPLAISLICGMAHSTQRTRAELWAHNGLELLLGLLQEQVWQGAALDALAAWLSEDASRVEPRLAAREACQRFVALFAAYAPSGDSETLSRLLKPFLRILRHSKRITVEMGQGGLTPIVLDTLKQTSALTALDLLQVLRTLYEFHLRPKQYVAQYGILEHLQKLASGSDRSGGGSVLVQKQASSLLQALKVQSAI